jgi:hypothetical protein
MKWIEGFFAVIGVLSVVGGLAMWALCYAFGLEADVPNEP